MGIQGLLPFLKKIHTPVNISQFQGCTVAVDAYCWLHKGAFSCAEKLALGEKTDQYVYYCMKYIDYLQRQDLKVIMVFDGCHLESKAGVEKTRRERREINRKKAAQFLREGKRSEAKECLQRCVDISPQMALELMKACRARGVDCIVAPYEADAQLAYLSKAGIAHIIVTEDSDLLLFGCEKIMFKMDFHGNGTLIEKSRLNEVMGVQTDFYTFDKFRYMCILSGCDYLSSISGIGLAKANKVFRAARQGDVRLLLKKLPTYLKMNIVVSNEYVEGFVKANNTFLYQLVFDPLTRSLRPLNPHPPELKEVDLNYAGKFLPPDLAYQIALGNIDVHNKESIANFDPDKENTSKGPVNVRSRHLLSIWDKRYGPKMSCSGSPCKEIRTCENKNRNNHSNSGVGKDMMINTQSLRKMLAKQNKDQDPAMTPKEMATLYAAEDDDDEQQMKRARRNLMECSGGFSVNCDMIEDDAVAKETDDGENFIFSSVIEVESDCRSKCENKCLLPSHNSFQYTAANIGEETFKRETDDSIKINKTSMKDHKQRNIFAVSKTHGKPNAGKDFVVEVKSGYFSSSKGKSSSPVTNISPSKLLPSTKSASSPHTEETKLKKKKCYPSSIQLLFERAGEHNKQKLSDANVCRSKNSFKERILVSEEKQQDSSEDKDTAQSSDKVQNKTLTVIFSTEKSDADSSSDKNKPKETAKKNPVSNKMNSKTTTISKLSAFSWSKSMNGQKIEKGKDRLILCEKASISSSHQKEPFESSERIYASRSKRKISTESNDSVTNPSSKRVKTSLNVSNYFNGKVSQKDSPSRESDSEPDVQEIQHQSYEGFLKSLGGDVYTKLLDESKESKKDFDAVGYWSKSMVEKSGEDEDLVKCKILSKESSGASVIDLTVDHQSSVKSTCRVSGLTKIRGKQRSLDSQQPTIQDFFSKYSFNRKQAPQVHSITREKNTLNDNSLTDENIFSICTPVVNNPLPDDAHVRRKLSL